MRWKISIWLTITSGIMIYAQYHAIENDINLQGVITAALPIATTSREHVVRHEGQDNDKTDSDKADSDKADSDKTDSDKAESDGNLSGTGIDDLDQNEVIVLTELGEVKGHPYGSSDIIGFFDIPYGVFEGPFAAPSKPQPWTTVHDVKEHSKRCPQLDYPNTYVGDTDCLTLTIFASSEVQSASVLFHIHDGNFISGSGDPSIYGPDNLVSKGTILVLPNYRLGPLGFLCLQNETAPGNAALKDLTLALEWTKKNIEAFGGKTSDITVSGDGASGALVGYLALSPTSRDLFTRAIAESGSVLSHWAVDRDPVATATNLAEKLRKNVNDESERINIFHDIDIQKLLIAADNQRFKPCIEIGNNTFMSETPWDVLLHSDKVNISFMIGSANHAGMHEAMYHSEESLLEMKKNVEMFLPDDLEFDTDELTLATGTRVKNQYFGENTMSMTDLEKLSLYYTDVSYLGPAIRGARPLTSAGTTVYFYEFSFVGELNRERNSLAGGIQGAARGDIVGYVFTQDREMPDPDTPEAKMVDTMTNLWTSFIKTGKPSAGNIEWNELKETPDSEEEWLSIELVPQLRKGLHVDRLRLWTEIYNKHFVDHNFAFGLTPRAQESMIAKVIMNLLIWCSVMGRPPPRRAFRDVLTSQGAARGYLTPRGHYAFLGLPYARPPTRHDRFKAPEPPPAWDGIFEASHRIKCPQDGEGDENCLVINVFVPEHAASCCMLPVLVLVHAGGFHSGWGSYQPPQRLIQDYVVVTFNYRLGALGFLCLGSPGAPGNAGLKDQVAALYWVHRNIVSFGGNPVDVTLYGTGSGATSIQLLLLSGLTKGLFHRAILDSGSVLSPSSLTYEPLSTGLNVAKSLGYNDEGNNSDLDEFYEKIPMLQLLNVTDSFLPCVENNIYYSHGLLEQDPLVILEHGDFEKVPMLVAYNDAEEVSLIADNMDRFSDIPDNFEYLLPSNIAFENEYTKHRLAEVIKEFYFNDEWNEDVINNYVEYINDVSMEYPVVKFSTMYADRSTFPVYLMKFSYKNAKREEITSNRETILKYFYASDDLDDEEEQIAVKLVNLWTNFIKFGDPTPLTTTLIPVVWQPVNIQDDNVQISRVPCLVIGRTLKMDEHPSSQRLSFWDLVYSKFYRLHRFD